MPSASLPSASASGLSVSAAVLTSVPTAVLALPGVSAPVLAPEGPGAALTAPSAVSAPALAPDDSGAALLAPSAASEPVSGEKMEVLSSSCEGEGGWGSPAPRESARNALSDGGLYDNDLAALIFHFSCFFLTLSLTAREADQPTDFIMPTTQFFEA